jgi:multiple sugar transport system substrate-binding protein
MNRRVIPWILFVSILCGVLSACVAPAAPAPAPAQPAAPAPAATAEVKAAEQPTAAAAGAKPYAGQTLNMIYFDATYADAAQASIAEFEAQTGAKVNLIRAPYANLYEKEFTDLVSGGGSYDLMQVASQWDGQFAPYLLPIDKYLAQDPAAAIDKFIPGVARVTGTWDNVRFGIPNACDAYGIIYRTDIFDKEGIKVDPVNWTWDQYAALAKQLTKDNMFGTAIAGEKDQLDAYWTARYWSQGGHLMSPDWKTALPQSVTSTKSLQMVMDLLPYMPPGVMSYAIPDENNAFVQGKTAMAELWPSLIRGTANDPAQSKVAGKWGILPYPGHSPQLSSWSLAIPKTTKVPDLAWEWIKFYTQDSKQRAFLDKFGIGPTRQAIYQDPAVIEKHPDFPNMLISLNGVRPRFRIAQSQETFDYLDDRISDTLTKVMTPQQATEAVTKQWEEKISADPPKTPYTDDYVK